MAGDNGTEGDDRLSNLLAAYHDVLTGQSPSSIPPQSLGGLDNESLEQLRKAQVCLELLESARRELADGGNVPRRRLDEATRTAWSVEGNSPTLSTTEPTFPNFVEGTGDGVQPSLSFGRFQLMRPLGQGGFGMVYLARDPLLERDVALKIPQPQTLMSVAARKRFLREAQLLAQVRHLSLVTVYEAGEVGELCYIASEYCSGPNLSQYLKEQGGSVPPRAAAQLVLDLADGMNHVHRNGIIHRDLKPSNVLLERIGGDEVQREGVPFRARITDFGIARLTGDESDLTVMGSILGTPRFMSPEQASGRQSAIGPASDIYSLGAILYVLLTGEAPILGETDIDTLRKIERTEPRSIRRKFPTVPRDLEAICQKCLEKDPARRYASACELADDLRQFLSGKPTHARPLTRTHRLVRWARREPALATIVVLVVGSVAGILGVTLWYNARLSTALKSALEQKNIARNLEYETRIRAYASEMRLVNESWDSANTATLRSLLEEYVPAAGSPDLRSFEWWLYYRLMNDETSSTELGAHAGGVQSIAVSPRGDVAASGGSDGVIRLWDVATGALRGELKGHAAVNLNCLAFGHDGARLASASDDKSVRAWDVVLQKELIRLDGHTDWVSAATFLGSENSLASGGADKVIIVWDLETGREKRRLVGHTDTVRALAFHPESGALFSSGEDATVRVWDVESGEAPSLQPSGLLQNPSTRWVRGLAIEPNQKSLTGVYFSDSPVIWDLSRRRFGELRGQVKLDFEPRSVSVGGEPDDPTAAYGLEEGLVRIASYGRTPKVLRVLRGHTDTVDGIALTPDGKTLVTGSQDGTVRRWDLGDEPKVIREYPTSSTVADVAITADGRIIAVLTTDGRVALIEFATLKAVRTIDLGEKRISSLAFSPDQEHLALLCNDSLCVFSTKHDVEVDELELPLNQRAHSIVFSPSGRLIGACCQSNVAVIDFEKRAILRRLPHPGEIEELAFLNDNEMITPCTDGRLRVWSMLGGREERTIPLGMGGLSSLILSPDGRLVAVRGLGRVAIVELATGRIAATIPHENDIGRMEFLGGGRTLLVSGGSRGHQLWNTGTWQPVGTLNRFGVSGWVAASADGFWVAAPDGNRVVVIDARPGVSEDSTPLSAPQVGH